MEPSVSSARGTKGRRSHVALGLVLTVASALLVGCGSDSSKPVLTWYINPDPPPPANFEGGLGQAGIAERCSTDDYTIVTEQLPGDATQQRIQLARRLAADDPEIDLMSLDPVFTGEFASAEFLATIPPADAEQLSGDALQGAVIGATWDENLVVAPLWANTQVLWYRKSFAEKAGLDMSQPVTWKQIIDAAADNDGKVGVQANKYEGYVVWINALVLGAGGDIVSDTDKGVDASIDIDSQAGEQAAAVIEQLARSNAAEADLSVSNEGTVLAPLYPQDDGSVVPASGGFLVNWTFAYANYKSQVVPDNQPGIHRSDFEDLGWARYPQTVQGETSRPPLGGINIGVNVSSQHTDLAVDALSCLTSLENQVTYAVETGNMPSAAPAYDNPKLQESFPADLLKLYRDSIDSAGPRPISPYWSDISSAVQSTWHSPTSVNASTPQESARFINEVLQGKTLL